MFSADFVLVLSMATILLGGVGLLALLRSGDQKPSFVVLMSVSPTSKPKSVVVDQPFKLETVTRQGFEFQLIEVTRRISLRQFNHELTTAGLLPTTVNDLVQVSDQLDGMGQVIALKTEVGNSGKVALPVLLEINGQGHVFPDYGHRRTGLTETIVFHKGEQILVKKPVSRPT